MESAPKLEDIPLSDEKLLKYLTEEEIKEISSLFSSGKFNEIISTYFTIERDIPQEEKPKNATPFQTNYSQSQTQPQQQLRNQTQPPIPNKVQFFPQSSAFKNNPYSSSSTNQNRTNFQKAPKPNIMFSEKSATTYNSNTVDMTKAQRNNNITNNIIDDYMIAQPKKEKVFSFDLLEKMKEDALTQQILLAIVLYSLIKTNKDKDAMNLFNKYKFSLDKALFTTIMLKSKFYIKLKKTAKAIEIFSEAIEAYENFRSNINTDNKDSLNNSNIIFVETYGQKFKYFENVFNFLFCLNDLDSKIKKLYYELKFCLYSLNFYSEGFKLILKLYNYYPNDVQIQFEITKDSILFSKFDKYKQMLEVLKNSKDTELDEYKKNIYDNYVLYSQGLCYLAQDNFNGCKECFSKIYL